MSPIIKLSAPEKRGYWEIPILYEDEHLLALDKPSGLLSCPDRYNPERPNLMRLLHDGIKKPAVFAREHQLGYLANAHRLDFETTGIFLLAKAKPVLVALADLFGADKPTKYYTALVQGVAEEASFEVDAAIAPHPTRPGVMRVVAKAGKKSVTRFVVTERFERHTLIRCQPLSGRTHQVRVHLHHYELPIVGDEAYGGRPLLLSRLKPHYRLKEGDVERPLISRVALHAEQLILPHPVTGATITITSPLPKDLVVALKYLRRYTLPGQAEPVVEDPLSP